MRFRLVASSMAVFVVTACSPERRPSGVPSGGRDAGTSSVAPDAGEIDLDGGAESRDGGRRMYCGDQVCAANESCSTCATDCGPCMCEFGFVPDQMRCVPDAPEPFRFRSTDDVCGRWRQDHITDVGVEWTATAGSADPCDPGTMTQASHDNAVLRTNLYRWLVGLDEVVEDPTLRAQQQACAVVLEAIGDLTHTPPPTAPCHTPEGAAGAGSSNIAFAGGGLARSVDLYVGDQGVDSLGHRRWAFNPAMGRTTFGYKPPFSCMYAFDDSGTGRGDFVAYPPPGYVPVQAARGRWSFGSRDFSVGGATSVQIDTGTGFADVPSEVLGGGFGAGPVVAFDPPSSVWSADAVVRVAIRGTGGGDFVYTVVFFDCP